MPRQRNGRMSPAAAAVMNRAAGDQEDVMERLLAQARERVQAQMTPAQIEDPSDEDLALARDLIRPLVTQAGHDGSSLPGAAVDRVVDQIFGFGPLAPYLADDGIEEIIVNGPGQVWVIHAERGKELTGVRFRDAQDVVNFVNRAAGATAGRWLDRANPKLDARMRDGSRLHAVMDPLTVNVPIAVTIRRHRLVARTLQDLVNLGTITAQVEAFLQLAVDGRLNLVVAGGTSSGKCLAGDQPVVLGDGRLVPIGELVERQFASQPIQFDGEDCWYVRGNGEEVITWNPGTGEFEKAPVLAYTRNPAPNRLVRLATQGGREITATEAHPFFVLEDGAVRQVPAGDLSAGQAIAIPTTLPGQADSDLPNLFDFLPQVAQEAPLYVSHQSSTVWALVEAVKEREGLSTIKAVRDKLEADGVKMPRYRAFQEWRTSNAIPLPALLALLKRAGLRAEDVLSEGVRLKTKTAPREQAIKWSPRPTESMMRFLGWVLCDGHVARSYVEITKKDVTVQEKIISLAKKTFDIEAEVYDYGYRAPVVRYKSKALADLMRTVFEIPATGKSHGAAIPQWALSLPDQMIAALLSGLFDGDAYLGEDSLEYTTVSESLAWQVHYLLLRLGVDNSLIERCNHWRVVVYAGSLSRLAQLLSFYTPHKAERLDVWRGRKARHSNYGIPGLGGLLREVRISAGLTFRDLSKKCGLSRRTLRMYESGDRSPTRQSLNKLARSLPDTATTRFMRRLSTVPVKWAPITEIECIEDHPDRHVYDLVVGGTHTFVAGKGGIVAHNTNFLNALCDGADDGDRFVLIEDTPELQVDKTDVVQLTTRSGAEEAQAFTMADLVVQALRMRPDRIITGEARGPEVADVLMAANTGHDGQMLTVHANSTRDVIGRLETMYLLRGHDVPLTAIRRQIADAFQLVLFIRRVSIGPIQRRFVTQIAEMQPSQFMEGDKVVVQNVFQDEGQGLAWTGYYPQRLAQKLGERGIDLSIDFFRQGGARG